MEILESPATYFAVSIAAYMVLPYPFAAIIILYLTTDLIVDTWATVFRPPN